MRTVGSNPTPSATYCFHWFPDVPIERQVLDDGFGDRPERVVVAVHPHNGLGYRPPAPETIVTPR